MECGESPPQFYIHESLVDCLIYILMLLFMPYYLSICVTYLETFQYSLPFYSYFLREREMAGLNLIPVGTWSLRSPQHAKQADGISCGIYVIQVDHIYISTECNRI